MTANFITVLAVVAGIVWLGLMVVSALRNRGGEEVAPNLQPGIDDQQLETRRLEKSQKVAIVSAAFLAISLPLYFLGENNRQEGFVEQFDEESVLRGEHLVEEFGCYSCHGPLGVGGVAPFIEKRSGVAVSWVSPPIDDVFYRYDEDEVNFWLTFGRGNTPMIDSIAAAISATICDLGGMPGNCSGCSGSAPISSRAPCWRHTDAASSRCRSAQMM